MVDSSRIYRNQDIGKKATMLSIGNLLNTVISVVSVMVVTRMLSPYEFAAYKQTFIAFNFILPFLSLGLTQGLYYFLPTENARFRGRVYDSFIIYSFVGILFSLIILCGGNKILANVFNNPDIESLLLFLIPYSLIVLLTQCTTTILNILNKLKSYILINLISSLVITLSLIGAILLSPNAKTAVVVMSIGRVIQGLIFIYLIIKSLPRDDWRPRLSTTKQLILFSFPLGITSMLGIITSQMDSLFVSVMSTPREFAIYAVAAIEVPIIGIVLGSISTAIIPELRRLVVNNDLKKCAELLNKSARRVASITFPVACFLAFWSEEFIIIMYSDKYIEATPIFQVYLLYFLARIMFTSPVFTALGMSKYLLYRTVLSISLNALLTYLFILIMGPIGAAVGTIISGWVIFLIYILPQLSKKLSVPKLNIYPLGTVLRLVIFGMIVGAVTKAFSNYFINHLNVIFYFACSGILFLIVYCFFAYFGCKDEYLWIINYLKKKYVKGN